MGGEIWALDAVGQAELVRSGRVGSGELVEVALDRLAARMEALGFVIVARSAVPELMAGITTAPPTGPPTDNPWRPGHTVGGSSGGSAAAVAAGIVPVAHGSDSTGSLRYPASCCGVLTLKPSAGRVASRLPGGLENVGGAHVDFVLARSVRDLRAIFAAVAQPPGASGGGRVARIGMLDRMPFDLPVDSVVSAALGQVGDRLAALGVEREVVSAGPFETYGLALGPAVRVVADARRAAVVDWMERQAGRTASGDDLSGEVVEAVERGRRLTADGIDAAWRIMLRAAAAAVAGLADLDAVLLPVLDVAPWPAGKGWGSSSPAGPTCRSNRSPGSSPPPPPDPGPRAPAARRPPACRARCHRDGPAHGMMERCASRSPVSTFPARRSAARTAHPWRTSTSASRSGTTPPTW